MRVCMDPLRWQERQRNAQRRMAAVHSKPAAPSPEFSGALTVTQTHPGLETASLHLARLLQLRPGHRGFSRVLQDACGLGWARIRKA